MKRSSLFLLGLCSLVVASVSLVIIQKTPVSAACDPNIGDGRVTLTASIPANARYTVWLRMKAPDTTNNSVLVNVGADYCGQIVGDSNTTVNTWKWVQGPAMTLNLPVGNSVVVIGGREPGVAVDRILLVSDGCVPDDVSKGDNCYDNTPPLVGISSPVNNATITTSPTTIIADGGDGVNQSTPNKGINKVEFYDGTTLIGTDTSFSSGTPGWSVSWNNQAAGNGPHTLTIKAYDFSNNVFDSSIIPVNVTINVGSTGDTQAPTANPTFPFVAAEETLVNNIITVRSLRQVVIKPSVTDNVGVTSQTYKVNGVTKLLDANGNFAFDNKNGDYAFAITATDAAGNTLNRTITVKIRHPDIVRDNAVNFDDFTRLLIQWGTSNPETDLSGNNIVDFDDFTKLLLAWTG